MKKSLPWLLAFVSTFFLLLPVLGGSLQGEEKQPIVTPEVGESEGKHELIAQRDRRVRKARKKHLVKEKIIKRKKGSDSTTIDLDAANINGERKTPLGTIITKRGGDKNYDFIWIRQKWHPEMLQSAKSLDAGK